MLTRTRSGQMDCRSGDELLLYFMLIVDLCIYRTPVTYRIAAQVVILEVSNVHSLPKMDQH